MATFRRSMRDVWKAALQTRLGRRAGKTRTAVKVGKDIVTSTGGGGHSTLAVDTAPWPYITRRPGSGAPVAGCFMTSACGCRGWHCHRCGYGNGPRPGPASSAYGVSLALSRS